LTSVHSPSVTIRRPPAVAPSQRRANPDAALSPDAIIIGDGITGLACAHYLLKAGRVPLILCAAEPGHERLRFFDFEGLRIDAFHLPIRPLDRALQGLLDDLELGHSIRWRDASHRTRTPGPASLVARARSYVGRRALRATELVERSLRRGSPRPSLAEILAGPEAWHDLVLPGARAVLGEPDAHVGTDTLLNALRDCHPTRERRLGMLEEGWFECMLRLRRSIAERGGAFLTPHTDTRLELSPDGIELTGAYACRAPVGVSTLPSEELGPLLGDTESGRSAGLARTATPGSGTTNRQDVVSVCVVARAGDLGSYSCTLQDPNASFPLCVQADRLLPAHALRGLRVFYLTRRFPHGSLREPDEVLAKQAVESLRKAAPGFEPDDILRVYVSVASAAEYVAPVGAPRSEFTRCLAGATRFFESSCVQQHPRPSGIETGVLMARDAASTLLRELG